MDGAVSLFKWLWRCGFIEFLDYDEEGNIKIAFHVTSFDLRAFEEFAHTLNYMVVDVQVQVRDNGRITLYLQPLR